MIASRPERPPQPRDERLENVIAEGQRLSRSRMVSGVHDAVRVACRRLLGERCTFLQAVTLDGRPALLPLRGEPAADFDPVASDRAIEAGHPVVSPDGRFLYAVIQAGGRLAGGFYVSDSGLGAEERRLAGFIVTLAGASIERIEAHERRSHDEERLVRAERLSSIGILTTELAHEINNPLAGLTACIRDLREGSVDASGREAYFDAAEDGLGRISRIVNAVLGYVGRWPPERGPVDAHQVFSSCLVLLEPMRSRAEIAVDLRIAPQAFLAWGDRGQLAQAVMNVLQNALQASPPGGTVTVTAQSNDGTIEICVGDEGSGISNEALRRATEPFFTTKVQGEGTGLGLSVTRAILEQHRGSLSLTKREPRGTNVTLRLPGGASP